MTKIKIPTRKINAYDGKIVFVFIFLIFYGTSDFSNDGQRLDAKQLEGFQLRQANGICDITFVLEYILNAHFVIGPSLWFGFNETLESAIEMQSINGMSNMVCQPFGDEWTAKYQT